MEKQALGLSRFLRNERTVPPLTIAITGAWGAGKSSLMNLLAADLRSNGFRPVFFNAWHNQQEGNVLASIFEAIRRTGLPSIATVEGLLFRATLLLRRCRRHWLFFTLLCLLLAASAGLLEARPLWLKELWKNFLESAPEFVQTLAKKPGENAPAWILFTSMALSVGGFILRSLKTFGIKPEEMVGGCAT